MNVGELIEELKKYDPSLPVVAAGEDATRVVKERCGDDVIVRIFKPWDVRFITPMYSNGTTGNAHFTEESKTAPQDMGRYDPYTDTFVKE